MKLIIPGRLPGLNDMTDAARRNRYESAKMKNDGWKQIADVTHRFRVDQTNPRIEVELIEIRAS